MKNPRTVFGIVAFVVAFVFSVGLVRMFFPAPVVPFVPAAFSRHDQHSALGFELEDFIRRDESNGSSRDVRLLSGSNIVSADYAESVENYWSKSSAMDAKAFPREFRVAWNEHMKAWQDYSEFLNEMKGTKVDRRSFYSESGRFSAEISRTWEAVLDSARQNGAHVR